MNPPVLTNLFARLLEQVRTNDKPTPVSASVDTRFYTDQSWFEKELASVIQSQPLIVGHTSMLKKSGDQFVHDHTGKPIIVVRGKDDTIRAFLNVCRHRGVRLANGEGVFNRPSFVCPYHNWVYDLEGNLSNVPLQEECFPDLDVTCHSLKELSLEICEGLIFVSLDPERALDIDAHMGGIQKELAAFNSADHVFFRESVTVKKTNWKLIIEAFLDGYHVARLHRKTVGPMFMDSVSMCQRVDNHALSVVARKEFEQALQLEPEQWDLRHHASCAFYIFPNTEIIIHPDYISYLSLFPTAVDETIVVHGCLINEEPKDEKARAHWERAFDIIENGVFQAEDLFVCEQAQLGMSSGANKELLFGTYEMPIMDFHQILADTMGAYKPE
ncbi:MAG: aromatic ring-hydroxylating dioxygenase subunit alpha [Pseudomonadales bacterium]